MPHVTLYALEAELAGREPGLIRELTNAVTTVFGDDCRDEVLVELAGQPTTRSGLGGKVIGGGGD
ncbi:hypothetical protein [Actinoplanes regularis]|uniref:hypothetical protein n=1 Tax=Actinoplanes regularis TaxID=52697 RepID=UPI0025552231|nr:hypothetical protein [Actinoplanes regularis]GLW27779.1 hypothetical protein Areg01_07190 [Actinoplanes regularis]